MLQLSNQENKLTYLQQLNIGTKLWPLKGTESVMLVIVWRYILQLYKESKLTAVGEETWLTYLRYTIKKLSWASQTPLTSQK